MIRSDRRVLAIAIGLAALAGFVDAVGFLRLGGFFVSFMSGNSTRAAVGIAERSSHALIAAGLIASFVTGVTLGSLAGQAVGYKWRRVALLWLVAALLMAAALLPLPAAAVCMALAMGATNVVFEQEGEISFGVTYMTGALVKLGQRLAALLRGSDRTGWIPYALLWLGLAGGATLGALAYPRLGMDALLAPALAAALLSRFTR